MDNKDLSELKSGDYIEFDCADGKRYKALYESQYEDTHNNTTILKLESVSDMKNDNDYMSHLNIDVRCITILDVIKREEKE